MFDVKRGLTLSPLNMVTALLWNNILKYPVAALVTNTGLSIRSLTSALVGIICSVHTVGPIPREQLNNLTPYQGRKSHSVGSLDIKASKGK
jgi:hypothetical protein